MGLEIIQNGWMKFAGFMIFLIFCSSFLAPLSIGTFAYPIFQFIINNQLGLILLWLPVAVWGFLKDWRWLGIAIVVVIVAFKLFNWVKLF